MVVDLPTGTVTFAFVDVVGSTSAFTDYGEAFVRALTGLHATISDYTTANGGVVVKTEGDGAFLAFGSADAAVRAMVEMQARMEAIAHAQATPEPRLRVRAGAHAGSARPVAGDYVALPVNIAARVTTAAGAGQALVSPAVVDSLTDPDLVELAGDPVGEFALKDVRGPIALYRVAGGDDPPRAPRYRRTNVAEPMTSFLGRASEIGELRDLVAAHRLVTVVGPGGMGKTRIASQLLLETAGSYHAGAWMVELAAVTRPDQVIGQVATSLGATASSAEELSAELRERGPMVVLLDNCEHVIDVAAQLAAELISQVPTVRVLATSREPLRIEGEVVWRIPALTGDAVRCDLFEQRVHTASGGMVQALDRAELAQLCEALDGSPLAIELAAAHAQEVPISRLLSLVRAGADPLARRGGGRQSSLDAVVSWSLDRLDAARREALLVLSQAPSRLTADEAGLLLRGVGERHRTSPDDLLSSLVRVSLVDLDGYEYRLLDTIRAAARRALDADPDLSARARTMLHEAAAALVDVNHDFSSSSGTIPRPAACCCWRKQPSTHGQIGPQVWARSGPPWAPSPSTFP